MEMQESYYLQNFQSHPDIKKHCIISQKQVKNKFLDKNSKHKLSRECAKHQ